MQYELNKKKKKKAGRGFFAGPWKIRGPACPGVHTNYGFHPKTMYPTDSETKNPSFKHSGHWLKSIHQKTAATLEETKRRMGKYYNLGKQTSPEMNPGGWVLLNAKNIRTKSPTKKLAHNHYGPFKILDKIGSRSFILKLDKRWKIHNDFYVSLLEPYKTSEKFVRTQDRPEPEEIAGENAYEVEKIIKSEVQENRCRVRGRSQVTKTLYYLVKWLGYPDDECTWEPGKHLGNASVIMEVFHQDNPTAPVL